METEEMRRLLELAAKAAWYALRVEKTQLGIDAFYVDGRRWNPFADDGDALRLAVALKIHHRRYSSPATIRGCRCPGGYVEAVRNDIEEREPVNGDPYAATRRAIVRAAAAIGEAAR